MSEIITEIGKLRREWMDEGKPRPTFCTITQHDVPHVAYSLAEKDHAKASEWCRSRETLDEAFKRITIMLRLGEVFFYGMQVRIGDSVSVG